MNNMKLTALVALATLTMSVRMTTAQEKPVTFGVKIGANLSSLGGDANEMKSAIKYQVGVSADIALGRNTYLLTGLNLQEKKVTNNGATSEISKLSPIYLQVPLHLAYKLPLSTDIKLLVGAGPYVAYGIGGNAKGTGMSDKVFSAELMKKLDYGAGATAALEFGKFGLGAGYDIGLNNVSEPKGTKLKNRTAYLTVGYKF